MKTADVITRSGDEGSTGVGNSLTPSVTQLTVTLLLLLLILLLLPLLLLILLILLLLILLPLLLVLLLLILLTLLVLESMLSALSDLDAIDLELPVSLLRDVRVYHRLFVILRVTAAENELAADPGRRVTVQVHGEDRLVEQALLHHVLDDWFYAVDSDLWKPESKNSVKLRSNERLARLLGRLRKHLILDLGSGDVDIVNTQEAGHAARSVLDGEPLAVLSVCARLARIVLLVQLAGKVGSLTLLRRHPQVRGPSVEDNLERLRWISDADDTVILRIFVVLQRLW